MSNLLISIIAVVVLSVALFISGVINQIPKRYTYQHAHDNIPIVISMGSIGLLIAFYLYR